VASSLFLGHTKSAKSIAQSDSSKMDSYDEVSSSGWQIPIVSRHLSTGYVDGRIFCATFRMACTKAHLGVILHNWSQGCRFAPTLLYGSLGSTYNLETCIRFSTVCESNKDIEE
jgi:hypothetical protein